MRRSGNALALFFAALTGFAALFASLAPLGSAPGAWAGPNLLLVVMAFWCVRRPEAAPALLVFAFGLTHDLLRDGPIGAELFALLIATEALRGVAERRPALTFASEWARMATAVLAFEVIGYALLAASVSPTPAPHELLQRLLATVLIYPLVAWIMGRLFNLRRDPGPARLLRV